MPISLKRPLGRATALLAPSRHLRGREALLDACSRLEHPPCRVGLEEAITIARAAYEVLRVGSEDDVVEVRESSDGDVPARQLEPSGRVVTARQDARIDLKRLHAAIGASGRLSFGSANQLMEALGVTPGTATSGAPFGCQVHIALSASPKFAIIGNSPLTTRSSSL